MFSVDPALPITRVSDITATSVKLSWSVGQTNVINTTVLYYKGEGASRWDGPHTVTGTSYNVTSLQPGTEYQFSLTISSYRKTAAVYDSATTGSHSHFLDFVAYCYIRDYYD